MGNEITGIKINGVLYRIDDSAIDNKAIPDWKQSDSSKEDFIRNRTHYAVPVFDYLTFRYEGLYNDVSPREGTFQVYYGSDPSNPEDYVTVYYWEKGEISTEIPANAFPSATDDGAMPLVASTASRRVDYKIPSKTLNAPEPVRLIADKKYQVYLDGSLLYEGYPLEVTEGMYDTNGGTQRSFTSGMMLGNKAAGVIIYTDYTVTKTMHTFEMQAYEQAKKADWYICLATALATEEHTITISQEVGEAIGKKLDGAYLDMDDYPAYNSSKPVKSGGVYTRLSEKQNLLTFDNYPTYGSQNVVKSGGVYSALSSKVSYNDMDDTPTQGSDAPVTSDGLYQLLQQIQDLQYRVTVLEAVISGVDMPASVSNDGDLSLAGPHVSYVNDIIEITASNAEFDSEDGMLVISNTPDEEEPAEADQTESPGSGD